jgi:hypothetical protein
VAALRVLVALPDQLKNTLGARLDYVCFINGLHALVLAGDKGCCSFSMTAAARLALVCALRALVLEVSCARKIDQSPAAVLPVAVTCGIHLSGNASAQHVPRFKLVSSGNRFI